MKLRSKKAYSLLELAAILAIMTTACLIIAPTIPSFFGMWKTKSLSRQLAGKLREARQTALATQIQYGIYIDTANSSYEYGYEANYGFNPLETDDLEDGFTITPSVWTPQDYILFDHLGAPVISDEVLLSIDGPDGSQRSVRVTPVSGKIEIE